MCPAFDLMQNSADGQTSGKNDLEHLPNPLLMMVLPVGAAPAQLSWSWVPQNAGHSPHRASFLWPRAMERIIHTVSFQSSQPAAMITAPITTDSTSTRPGPAE